MPRHSIIRQVALLTGAVVVASCARRVTTSPSPATASGASSSSTASASTGATATITEAATMRGGLPGSITRQMIQEGDSIFNHGSCQRCHGMNGTHGRTAPDLTDSTWLHIDGSYNSIVHIISTGVPAAEFKSATSRFPMRPMGGMQLTDDQLHAVAAYVYTLSHHS